MKKVFIATALFAGLSIQASAQENTVTVYKSIGPNGVAVYSQQPSPGASAVKIVTQAPKISTPPVSATQQGMAPPNAQPGKPPIPPPPPTSLPSQELAPPPKLEVKP